MLNFEFQTWQKYELQAQLRELRHVNGFFLGPYPRLAWNNSEIYGRVNDTLILADFFFLSWFSRKNNMLVMQILDKLGYSNL